MFEKKQIPNLVWYLTIKHCDRIKVKTIMVKDSKVCRNSKNSLFLWKSSWTNKQGRFAILCIHFTCSDLYDESLVVGLAPATLLCAGARSCAWCCWGHVRYLERLSNSSAVLSSPGRWKLCPSGKSSIAASLDCVHRLLDKEELTWPLSAL